MWEIRYKGGFTQRFTNINDAILQLDLTRKSGGDGFIYRVG